MEKAAAKVRIEKLRKEVERHRYLYHVLDREEISDAALDSLKHELSELEKQFPEFISFDSPTQRVGGKPLAKFTKVPHQTPMLSLEDAFDEDELRAWEARITRIDPGFKKEYFAELKIDGFAVSLEYEGGRLRRASTRGDGQVGEDVTKNVKTVEAVPLTLAYLEEVGQEHEIKKDLERYPHLRGVVKNLPARLEIRGEIYMTKKAFERVNLEQRKKGLPLYANPRNIAAGSIRQLDPKIAASRKLEFLAYDIVTDAGQETHEESHMLAKFLGFRVIDPVAHCGNLECVIEFYKKVGMMREKLPFLIDGIVVQANDRNDFRRLGIAGKTPRAAIAFKFAGKEATTVLKDIIVQVGRRGTLTPVAVLEPVPIGGVTVSRATLHNEDEIRRLGVKVGDTVIVERAGDVIPRIKEVLVRLRPKNARAFHMPKKCPVCGKAVARKAGEVAWRCVNPDCPAVHREITYHFVSRKGFDIQGLGPKTIDILLDQGLIQDAADLFILKEGDLSVLERFGEKSAANLVGSIHSRKAVPLSRFIYSLGIPHVGEETAIDLARSFGSLKTIAAASKEELLKVSDIGEVVARSISEWFSNPASRRFLEKLTRRGVRPIPEKIPTVKKTLAGKTFVLTGGLESMSRDEAKEKIRSRGGDIAGSVSKKTDFVVVGSEAGSKLDRAKALGVKTLSEEEFLKLIR